MVYPFLGTKLPNTQRKDNTQISKAIKYMKTSKFPKIIAHRGHLTDLPVNAIGSKESIKIETGLYRNRYWGY